MFKHILVAIDGSELAFEGARKGLGLAKAIGARVTAVSVLEPYGFTGIGEAWQPSRDQRQEHLTAQRQLAQRAFADIAGMAREHGVPLETVTVDEREIAEGIVDAAKAGAADLIVIASHGRGGVAKLVLGSVAAKVLGLAAIPVLVVK